MSWRLWYRNVRQEITGKWRCHYRRTCNCKNPTRRENASSTINDSVRSEAQTRQHRAQLNNTEILIGKFFVVLFIARKLERVRDCCLALLHARNHVRAAKPGALRQPR